jgi:hypothetical protein
LAACRHEAAHFVIGVVNGFARTRIHLTFGKTPSGELGFAGTTYYQGQFESITGPDAVRAAIRTCLAGEVARVNAKTVDDFADGGCDRRLAQQSARMPQRSSLSATPNHGRWRAEHAPLGVAASGLVPA